MQKSISFIMFGWPSKAFSILISQYIFDSQTGFSILITTGLSVWVSYPSWTSLYLPLPKGPDISYYSVGLIMLPELYIDFFILIIFYWHSATIWFALTDKLIPYGLKVLKWYLIFHYNFKFLILINFVWIIICNLHTLCWLLNILFIFILEL